MHDIFTVLIMSKIYLNRNISDVEAACQMGWINIRKRSNHFHRVCDGNVWFLNDCMIGQWMETCENNLFDILSIFLEPTLKQTISCKRRLTIEIRNSCNGAFPAIWNISMKNESYESCNLTHTTQTVNEIILMRCRRIWLPKRDWSRSIDRSIDETGRARWERRGRGGGRGVFTSMHSWNKIFFISWNSRNNKR